MDSIRSQERCRGTTSPDQWVSTVETLGCVVAGTGKKALLGDEVLRKELYATSAIVRTDALVLTISDAAFNLSVCFSEGIGTCGNAYHLSGLERTRPP